jgi:hypothetical protein
MRRPLLLVPAALVSLALANTVVAQADTVPVAPGPTTSTVTGTVISSAPNDPNRDARRRDLPATASRLGVIGLLGFLSLSGAATLRACRRRF